MLWFGSVCGVAGGGGRADPSPGPVPGLAPVLTVHADIDFEALVRVPCS